MLPDNVFSPRGYVHDRRGFAVTHYGIRDIAYILNTVSMATGERLAIETLTRDDNGEFVETSVIYPQIPYRITLGDPGILTKLNEGTGFIGQKDGATPIFNPGMSLNNNALTSPVSFGLNTSQGNIQINITRDQFDKLNSDTAPRVINVKRSSTTVGSMTFTNPGGKMGVFTYKARDSKASILVKNNNDTDELYISVTATVIVEGKENDTRFDNISATASPQAGQGTLKTHIYSLPVLLKLQIDRTQINNGYYNNSVLKPTAWRYLLPLSEWSRKINDAGSNDFATASWNCDIIPRMKIIASNTYGIYSGSSLPIMWDVADISNAVETYYYPVALGCMWTSQLDTVNNRIVSMSAVGELDPTTGAKVQKINYIVNNLPLSSMFDSESEGAGTGSYGADTSVSRMDGDTNQGRVLIAVTVSSPSQNTGFGAMYFFNSSSTVSASHMVINKVHGVSVAKSGDSFVLGCDKVTNGTDYGVTFLKCPTFSVMSNWAPVIRELSLLITGALGFTFIGHQPTLPNFYPTLCYSRAAHSSLASYRYNSLGEDNSFQNIVAFPARSMIREINNTTIELIYRDRLLFIIDLYFSYRTDGGGKLELAVPIGVHSYGDSNFDDLSYFRFYTKDNQLKIQSYDTQVLNINGTASMGYWANPTFDVGFQDHQGVFVTFILSNCSGIFRKGTGAIGDWDAVLNGVPVDPIYTRPDIMYNYGGNYTSYVSVGGSGYYWATIKEPTWSLSLKYNGDELVLNPWSCSFVDYTLSGVCNIHTHTDLDLDGIIDGARRPYTDAAFALSGVVYKLQINTPDLVVAEGTVDIEPPAPDASVTTTVDYKTISGTYNYSVARSDETSINNIVLVKNDVTERTIDPYILTGPTTGTIAVSTSNMIKGDWKAVQYRPLYQGSKGSDLESRRITFVGGHKYHLENVEIWIDGYDKTSEITAASEPWLYIKTTGNISVGIVADIKHEDFGDREAYSNLDLVYPMINKTYMMVVPRSSIPRSSSSFVQGVQRRTVYEEVPPVGLAYPNCGYIMANRLQQRWDSTAALNKASGVYGSIIEKDGESLTAAVDTDGEYHIFLIVEDEFSQRSVWCITNPKNNFRIPFAGI